MADPQEWLAGLDLVELDSAMLRALAHPMRNRIVSSLRLEGPATSAMLAERLRTNTGQTSYHVRALEEVGLVVEEVDRGTGRERWWKAAHRGHSWSETGFEDDADDRHAADWLQRYYHRMYTQWVNEWFDQRQEWSRDWREAAFNGDFFFMATPAMLSDFRDDLHDLLERYRLAGNDLDVDDDDVERFTVLYRGFPNRDLQP